MSKDLRYFMKLRYKIELTEEDEGGFVAHHPELPGCIAQGETADEAVINLREARESWVAVRLEEGLDVPEPRADVEYSGKFLVRLPKSLHADLADAARREGVSLNQLVVAALSGHLAKSGRTDWTHDWQRVVECLGFAPSASPEVLNPLLESHVITPLQAAHSYFYTVLLNWNRPRSQGSSSLIDYHVAPRSFRRLGDVESLFGGELELPESPTSQGTVKA